jgi:cell filamentation protein
MQKRNPVMSDYFTDDLILCNKLGLKDEQVLKNAEEEIVAARMVEVIENPVNGSYDFDMLKKIHRKLFSDIYEFAGEVRTVRIAKDNSVFCYPEFIEEYQNNIFEKLKQQNYLTALSKETFIQRFSELSGELNALHPFREGNGRTIRIFLKHLAEKAGWYVAYEDMQAEELLNADIKSFEGDLAPLMKLLAKHVFEYKE